MRTGDHLFMTYGSRGFKQLDLLEVNVTTGEARTLIQEKSKTFVETNLASGGVPNWRPVHHDRDIVWFSERDGWAHLYLLDGETGSIQRQITSGPWTVGDVLHVDETQGWIYFTGRGREAGRDPYFRHLYRAKLDGSAITLLTPENADHEVFFSPSGGYFVDNYSRLDALPTSLLRRADGAVVRELQRADAARLVALGWKMPIPFTVKARDGVTNLYGLMYTPSHVDPARKYPIIDNIYPGPQVGPVGNRAFSSSIRGTNAGLAELGFYVIVLDAMGTPVPLEVVSRQLLRQHGRQRDRRSHRGDHAARGAASRDRRLSCRDLRPLRRRLFIDGRDPSFPRFLQGRGLRRWQSRQPKLRLHVGREVSRIAQAYVATAPTRSTRRPTRGWRRTSRATCC